MAPPTGTLPLGTTTNLPTPPSTQNPTETQPDASLAAKIQQLKTQLALADAKNRRRRTKKNKRKRSPSPSHADDDDDERPPATRPRITSGADFHKYGRVITRTQGCYLDLEALILHGIKVDTDEDYNEQEELSEDHTLTTDYNWLCACFLNLRDTLLSVAKSLESLEDIAAQMTTGMESARNDDRGTLRNTIMDIIKQPKMAKELRGFRSPHTAALLLPLHLVDRASEPGLHDEVVSGSVSIVAEQLPAFLFPTGQKKDATTLGNLLTSDILIQAAKVIFHGPSAMGTGDGCRRKGKDGNAVLVGLKSFNARLIAYIACQVRFALSSASNYNKIDGEFDYEKFSDYIVKAMGRPGTGERAIALFNRRVLGVTPSTSLSSSTGGPAGGAVDPLEELWAESDAVPVEA
ncbi:hypothetical protein C8F01DRAFT_1120877 [Mycena amicta]|nr:hypothetical protein C8F01DRAFT_1120877 [Mycena amicta]